MKGYETKRRRVKPRQGTREEEAISNYGHYSIFLPFIFVKKMYAIQNDLLICRAFYRTLIFNERVKCINEMYHVIIFRITFCQLEFDLSALFLGWRNDVLLNRLCSNSATSLLLRHYTVITKKINTWPTNRLVTTRCWIRSCLYVTSPWKRSLNSNKQLNIVHNILNFNPDLKLI